jgi:hypothetical protein
MFPIAEAALSFREIADYWSREIHPPASSNELLSILVRAWWLGELRSNSRHSRLQLLKMMFTSKYKDDLGIKFVASDGAGSPDEESLKVYLYEISVPSRDTKSWDVAVCNEALQGLGQVTKESLFKAYSEFAVMLPSIELTFEEFTTWCSKRGYPRPKFWRPMLKKSKPGRPAEYNWEGVKARLRTYRSERGPVQTLDELLQKCADFACELHPADRMPADKTIREAIETHALAAAAGFDPAGLNPGK